MDDAKPPKTTYRLFRFDAEERIRSAAQLIDAADDEAAIEHAASLVGDDHVELWNGSRLVHVFGQREPKPDAS